MSTHTEQDKATGVGSHTPGPWEFEKSESRYQGSIHYAVKTSYKDSRHPHSPRFIAWMCGSLGESLPNRPISDYRDDPEIEADARLISAAPSLLVELEALLMICKSQPRPILTVSEQESAEAAIAKAKGCR